MDQVSCPIATILRCFQLHEAGKESTSLPYIQDELEEICIRRVICEGTECIFVRRWCTALLSALLDWQVQLVVEKIPKMNGRSNVAIEPDGPLEASLEDLILELEPLFPVLEGLGVDLKPIALHTPHRINHLVRMRMVIVGLPELFELLSEAHSRLDSYGDILAVVDPMFGPRLWTVFAEVPLMFIIRLLRVAARNET